MATIASRANRSTTIRSNGVRGGSARTWPVLTASMSPDWHLRHFRNPQETSQGQSIMPQYAWLLESKTEFEVIPQRMRGMQMLGVRYTDDEIEHSIEKRQRRRRKSSPRSRNIHRRRDIGRQAGHCPDRLPEQAGPRHFRSRPRRPAPRRGRTRQRRLDETDNSMSTETCDARLMIVAGRCGIMTWTTLRSHCGRCLGRCGHGRLRRRSRLGCLRPSE